VLSKVARRLQRQKLRLFALPGSKLNSAPALRVKAGWEWLSLSPSVRCLWQFSSGCRPGFENTCGL